MSKYKTAPFIRLEELEVLCARQKDLLKKAEVLIKDCMNEDCTTSQAHMWLIRKKAVEARPLTPDSMIEKVPEPKRGEE